MKMLVVSVVVVQIPRLVGFSCSEGSESKESKVAVRHVVVLSAVQKPRLHRGKCVAVKHHCGIYITSRCYIYDISCRR